MSANPCANGRHYDDLSCCHVQVPNEDAVMMAGDLDDVRDVVARMCMGRLVSDQEKELTLSRLDAVIALLPTVSESESRPR